MSNGFRHGEYDSTCVLGNVGSFSIEDPNESWNQYYYTAIFDKTWPLGGGTHLQGNEGIHWYGNACWMVIESGVSTVVDILATIGSPRETFDGGAVARVLASVAPGAIVKNRPGVSYFTNISGPPDSFLSNYYRFGGSPAIWTSTYPKMGTVNFTSAQFLVNSDTDGFCYFVVVPSGDPAPSSAQVKAGQDSSSSPVAAGFSGTVAVSASTEFGFSATNLVESTNYDVYLVAEFMFQVSPVLLSFKTLSHYYVDLSLNDSGHAGTTSDPWSYLDMFGIAGSSVVTGEVLYIRGQRDIGTIEIGDFPVCFYGVTWDKWGADPWRIRWDADDSDLTVVATWKNGIFSTYNMNEHSIIFFDTLGDKNYINMIFIREDSPSSSETFRFNDTAYVKGSTFFCAPGASFLADFHITSDVVITDSIINCKSINYSSGAGAINNCALTCPSSPYVTATDCQFNWDSPMMWPMWDSSKEDWDNRIFSAGITCPPEPGNPPYTGYATDPWGNARDNIRSGGIGALYMPAPTSMNFFRDSTVSDGTYADSVLNKSVVVSTIQADSSDSYFDSTSKINKVFVYYTHQDDRQIRRVDHVPPYLAGRARWLAGARDGTWEKTKMRVIDYEGAEHVIYRNLIGSDEDLTHENGKMNLNTL